MATFLMFGSFSIDAVKKISTERTKDAAALIDDIGGRSRPAMPRSEKRT